MTAKVAKLSRSERTTFEGDMLALFAALRAVARAELPAAPNRETKSLLDAAEEHALRMARMRAEEDRRVGRHRHVTWSQVRSSAAARDAARR